jgi:DNA repair protein RadD
MPELRPYQQDIVHRYQGEVDKNNDAVLMVMATGAGKTVVAGEIVKKTVERGQRALFLAHRRELVAQASRKLHDIGIDHGIIQAGYPAQLHMPVQVASIQTLHARAVRGNKVQMPEAELVIVDEAHHVRATSYQKILDKFPDATVLGLTATPCRGDGRGLGNTFDVLVEGPSIPDLIKDGFLVQTKVYAPYRPDLTGVKIRQGDYAENQLQQRMDTDQLVGDIVTHWFRLAERRRTVVFASGVAHSHHLRDEFRRAGVNAEHVDGSTPNEERDAILAKLAKGTVEVVCNCMVLTEGWDCPEVSCIVLARPTKSMGLFRQMVGRVLRPATGKTDCLVLDHAGAVFEHGFVDEPVRWTLDSDRRATAPLQALRGNGAAPSLVACPECSAVRWKGKPCPACGWTPRGRSADVEVVDGELAEATRNRTVKEPRVWNRSEFYQMVSYVGIQRGYKEGWAAVKYKEKFGDWPPRLYKSLLPMAPDEATRAWIRSRFIAWRKAQQQNEQRVGT